MQTRHVVAFIQGGFPPHFYPVQQVFFICCPMPEHGILPFHGSGVGSDYRDAGQQGCCHTGFCFLESISHVACVWVPGVDSLPV